MGLATDNTILYLELVSMGSVNRVIAEPMEVFSFALQKRAVKLILVHSHPSGDLTPSEKDKDTTDRLIQTGLIVNLPVIDHLIISETAYYSFDESGLLQVLQASLKYVPPYQIKIRTEQAAAKAREEGVELQKRTMAKAMKTEGYPIEDIMRLTGLSKYVIQRIKV